MNETKEIYERDNPGELTSSLMSVDPSSTLGVGNIIRHVPPSDMLVKGIITGVTVSAITTTGRRIIGNLLRSPMVWFGLGITAGYLGHKYRKEILAASQQVMEKGRTFVLRQRESLDDLLAEAQESMESTRDDG